MDRKENPEATAGDLASGETSAALDFFANADAARRQRGGASRNVALQPGDVGSHGVEGDEGEGLDAELESKGGSGSGGGLGLKDGDVGRRCLVGVKETEDPSECASGLVMRVRLGSPGRSRIVANARMKTASPARAMRME